MQANGMFGVKPTRGTFAAAEPKIGRWADAQDDDAAWPELAPSRPKATAYVYPDSELGQI